MFGNRYIWTKDGASCHTSKATQAYRKRKLGSMGFWSKELKPSSSPNLNPSDFSIWSHVTNKAGANYHSNIDTLKAAVMEVWAELPADFLKKCCSRFRARVEAVLEGNGGVFERKWRCF